MCWGKGEGGGGERERDREKERKCGWDSEWEREGGREGGREEGWLAGRKFNYPGVRKSTLIVFCRETRFTQVEIGVVPPEQ